MYECSQLSAWDVGETLLTLPLKCPGQWWTVHGWLTLPVTIRALQTHQKPQGHLPELCQAYLCFMKNTR